MSVDDNLWTGIFLVFLLFVFMYLALYHLRHISDSVYEGFNATQTSGLVIAPTEEGKNVGRS